MLPPKEEDAVDKPVSTSFIIKPEPVLPGFIPEPKPVSLLGPESATLRTLANFQHRDKPLPELFPFPFKPDVAEKRKKNFGKIPKPSRFVKGEMYHSDYDSGSEGFGANFKLPVKWRSCSSDNEESYYSYRFV